MARIVSLIASATEIVHALGRFGDLVGRSHECDFPPEALALPVCTAPRFAVSGDSREIDRLVRRTRQDEVSVYEIFDDVLERLQPTHILTQVQCEVCAVSLADVERSIAPRLPGRPRVVALNPQSLADIRDDFRRAGEALEADWRPVVERLQARMRALVPAAGGRRQRVACLDWLEPVMPARQWIPELVEMAGGINVDFKSWEDLVSADPEILVAMPCGFELERTAAEMHWLRRRPAWESLRAVRTGEVYIADGNQYFNRPGPRVVESLEILVRILQPEGGPPHPSRARRAVER